MIIAVMIRRTSLLVALCSAICCVRGTNPDANPFYVVFSNESSIGPDGPCWFIPQAIDFPDQVVQMLPSLTQLSMAVASSACSDQSASCPLPIPTLWQESGAWIVTYGPQRISRAVPGSQWDSWASALLRLQGTGKFYNDRITLYENGLSTVPDFLDQQAMMLSESYTATFPGGAQYTLDTGFLSLWSGQDTITWKSAYNGSTITFNRTLIDAYLDNYIPSVSYGLHVGSATHNVSGSLILGGYDSSRCISSPVVSDSESFELSAITLGVMAGASAYIDTPTSSTSMLSANGTSLNSLEVFPNPGVPYLYLPKDTCDAIASHLPVTYSNDFNLYFWNTEDPAYKQITSSPHFLSFSFSSGGQTATIDIPFALLDLSLESPLVSTSTPYFPCSPWTPAAAPYHLGRTFLQGAYLAQNWQSGKLFLGQAPGPDLSSLSPYVKTIASSDTSISPATNPPSWYDTWSEILTPLSQNQTSSTSSTSSSSGLSTGAIAGIAVGAVAIVGLTAVALFFMLKGRRRASWTNPNTQPYVEETMYYKKEQPGTADTSEAYTSDHNPDRYLKKAPPSPYGRQVDSISEVDGAHVSELDGHYRNANHISELARNPAHV